MGTHKTQHKPEDVATETLDYMNLMHPILKGPHCDRHFILNMDQMPVYFHMMPKRTLEVISIKTIHIQTLLNDTKCVMVAVMIAADGTVLLLTIIFKGKPDGLIAWREFQTYPTTHYHYRCQDNVWMDEEVMIAWVDEGLNRTSTMRQITSFPSSYSTAPAAT